MTPLVFGRSGQVATELARLLPGAAFLGRAEADLARPGAAGAAIAEHAPSAVINAAAWTAVDAAETEEEAALRLNAEAPGEMARACAARGIPFLHVSTDYVFDGIRRPALAARRSGGAARRLWPDQAGRRGGGTRLGRRPCDPAHLLGVLGAWGEFREDHAAARRRARQPARRRRSDRRADPGRRYRRRAGGAGREDGAQRTGQGSGTASPGILHFSGAPDVSWAGFAREIMARAGLACRIDEIASADYPTPAARPKNSRLDCAGLAGWGLTRPDWRAGLDAVLAELGSLKGRQG